MAVYKIFPTADATIYSRYPTQNAGLDEILEVSVKNGINMAVNVFEPQPETPILNDDLRRSLILFSDEDINTIKSFRTGSWQAGLKLYLANAENLSMTYSIEIGAVSSSWCMGTGKFSDYPPTINGVSWDSPNHYTGTNNLWIDTDYYLTPGGANWTGSMSMQDFTYKDSKDINADVTQIVNSWFSGSIQNNGFIVKHMHDMENDSGSYMVLNFFSVDTHTIYPPTLEMRWDDSSYATGSLSVINNNLFVASLDNNPGSFKANTGKYRFRINARDKYPTRTFTTSSVYLTNKALPEQSYWAIQDVKADDIVVDFDNDYTKVSCDGTSSYFDIYMNGLEPERYYKLLLKTVLPDGESIEIDNNPVFKVVR